MPALAADIDAATREAIIVKVQDAAILTRFPNARDGQKEPATGYFDSAADASAALAVRAALTGTVRRRFKVQVQDLVVPSLSAGVPCFRLTDTEQAVNAVHLTGRLEVNFEDEASAMELVG